MTAVYELVTGLDAVRHTEHFAELRTAVGTLAVAGVATVAPLGDALRPAANDSVIIEFRVDDVDARFARVRASATEVVLEPTTMPWGNRSALFRDPDGHLVNLFASPSANAE